MNNVSVVTCVSTADSLLKVSIPSLVDNAGVDDFDLVIVSWNASPAVREWFKANPWHGKQDNPIFNPKYETNLDVGYVPNIRGAINRAFEAGFELNDYVVFTNTDVLYGGHWLAELLEYADEDWIINSQHISPILGGNVITANLGHIDSPDFHMEGFRDLIKMHHKRGVLMTDEQRGGWQNTVTMPYVIHRKWWEHFGPWELTGIGKKIDPPDRRFFQRCIDGGVRTAMAMGSIVYHDEGGERRSGNRPDGTQAMPEEGVVCDT